MLVWHVHPSAILKAGCCWGTACLSALLNATWRQRMIVLFDRHLQVAVKYKNNLGYTPLHLAAKLGHLRVARELLMAGARADLKDQASGSVNDLAALRGTDPCVASCPSCVTLLAGTCPAASKRQACSYVPLPAPSLSDVTSDAPSAARQAAGGPGAARRQQR